MNSMRLLPILAWLIVVSCNLFTGEVVSPPKATEEGSAEVTEEVVKTDFSPVIPAPLYFLSGEEGNASLWRIEMDGATQKMIKDCCIRDYAVSPATGQIAYVTNEIKLVISNANGEEALEVNLDDVNYPQELDSSLAWSPDGKQLALGGENGLWVYMIESESLVQISGTGEFTTFIRPLAFDAWSPSGDKIMIIGHRPNANVDEIGIIPIVSGEVKLISILVPRRATWTPDGGTIYISSNFYGMMGILPSLIEVTVDDLEKTTLIESETTDEGMLGLYLEGAQLGSDGFLYYFYGEGPIDFEENSTGLSLYRSQRDGITDRVLLRPDTLFKVSDILWAEDMSLAVVASGGNSPENQTRSISILPTNGDVPAFSIPLGGYGLQWGQPAE